jgi:hypothetical protein
MLACLPAVVLTACGSDRTPPVRVPGPTSDLEKPSSTTGEYQVAHGAEVLPSGTDHLAHVVYAAGVSSSDHAADLPKLLRQEAG